MGLEKVLKALELSMKGNFNELDEGLLQDRQVRDTLTTFFAEQQTRPNLISALKNPRLVYEYLQLSLTNKEIIEGFILAYPSYFKGEGREIDRINPKRVNDIMSACRYRDQILKIFEFYLKNRKLFETFDLEYLRNRQYLSENLGFSYTGYKNPDKFCEILEFASEINPQLRVYANSEEVFMMDSPKQLIEFFNFYLANKKKGDRFDILYICANRTVVRKFNDIGIWMFTQLVPDYEIGFKELVKLASLEQPKIKDYWRSFEVYLKEDRNRINSLLLSGRYSGKEVSFIVERLYKSIFQRRRYGS